MNQKRITVSNRLTLILVIFIVLAANFAVFARPQGRGQKGGNRRPERPEDRMSQQAEALEQIVKELNAVKQTAQKEEASKTVTAIDELIKKYQQKIEIAKMSPEDRTKAMFEKRDTNSDQKLSLEEFTANSKADPEKIKKRFDRLDSDQDGFITLEEIQSGQKNRPSRRQN